MKKTLLILFLLLLFGNCSMADTRLDTAIKVGGENHLPPYQYVNDNGIYKGFCVDIVTAIGLEEGLDLELYPMPYHDILDNPDIDMILALEKKPEYADKYDFSTPYLTISSNIFVNKGNNFIRDLEDLKSVRVGIQKGNIPVALEKYIQNDSAVYVDNQQQGFLLLMMGNIDAFVGNRLTGLYTIQKWKQENFFKIVGEPIEPINYCFAFKKDNEQIVRIFDIGLEEIKRRGIYDEIYNKWFGEIIQSPDQIRNDIIRNVIWIFCVIFIIMIIIVRINHFLKKEVLEKTKELRGLNNSLSEMNVELKKEYVLRQQILSSVERGVVTIDRNSCINFVNSKAEKFIGNDNYFMKGISETGLMGIVQEGDVLSVLAGEQKSIRNESVIHNNAEDEVYTYHVGPLYGENNLLIGAVITFEDITNEKKMQKKMIQNDKMHVLGELMAVIAHEIRNPLTAIKNFIDLIPDKFDNQDFREKLIFYVPSELDRINKLITELLDYANPQMIDKMQVDIDKLVTEVATLLENQLTAKDIRLVKNIERNTTIFADRKQLKQVLLNLVLNAIQAMDKEQGIIEINCLRTTDESILRIKDNGRGIPGKKIPRVIEPFYTDRPDGTGLGLSICYQIINEHGGHMEILSEMGHGTEVTLSFLGERHKEVLIQTEG